MPVTTPTLARLARLRESAERENAAVPRPSTRPTLPRPLAARAFFRGGVHEPYAPGRPPGGVRNAHICHNNTSCSTLSGSSAAPAVAIVAGDSDSVPRRHGDGQRVASTSPLSSMVARHAEPAMTREVVSRSSPRASWSGPCPSGRTATSYELRWAVNPGSSSLSAARGALARPWAAQHADAGRQL